MSTAQDSNLAVEGPVVDDKTGVQVFTVVGDDQEISFTVLPETGSNGESGWGVRISGVAGPGIVHDQPWDSPQSACDAALRVIQDILELESMQRKDMERSQPADAVEESCADETGSLE